MPPAPNLLMALVVILCLALAVVVMSFGAVWSRLRKLSRPLSDTVRLVDDLAQRQRTMEALLARLDASGPARTLPDSSAKNRPASPSRRGDKADPSAVSGPTLIAVPNLAATPTEVSPAASAAAELARRFGAIWTMADMGSAPEAIARETGQPIGQVELILGLRRQLATGAGSTTGGRA
jgi:hypothetical protein